MFVIKSIAYWELDKQVVSSSSSSSSSSNQLIEETVRKHEQDMLYEN